jgi:hypothetical protein
LLSAVRSVKFRNAVVGSRYCSDEIRKVIIVLLGP